MFFFDYDFWWEVDQALTELHLTDYFPWDDEGRVAFVRSHILRISLLRPLRQYYVSDQAYLIGIFD